MLNTITSILLFLGGLIPNSVMQKPINSTTYKPESEEGLVYIYRAVFNHPLRRMDHLKFVYSDKATVEAYCGSNTLACTKALSPYIIVRESHKNDCDTIAHELLHNVIFEMGIDSARVKHHDKLFFQIVEAACSAQ